MPSQIYRRTLYKTEKLEITSRVWNPGVSKFVKDDMEFYSISSNVKIILSIEKERFVVEQKDHLRLLTFFETVTNWFYDKEMEDLYFKDENGNLCFNGKYNNLSTTCYTNQFSHSFMEAKPLLIMKDDKKYEGIILRINVLEACAFLLVREVLEISSILHTFDYSSETSLFLQIANHLSYVDKSGSRPIIVNGLSSQNSSNSVIDPFNLKGGFS